MIPVRIIGMGMGKGDLPRAYLDLIQDADVLVGGKRNLEAFCDLPCQKMEIRSPVASLVKAVRRKMESRKVVVLASGDPLFFGMGQTLIRELGGAKVEILPNHSSLAAAFARIKKPWANVPVVSLHGRRGENALTAALARSPLVFLLTGPNQGPDHIGSWLGKNHIHGCTLHVMERLGSPEEKHQRLTPAQAAQTTFHDPNVVILEQKEPDGLKQRLSLGAPEDWFEHENNLITKSEVRAVALSKLRLHDGLVLWDLGAGSGSVSCEAGLFIRNSPIIAVEKNQKRVAHIFANRKKFQVWNMQVVQAELPRGMADLPVPDRVFLGGGGKDLGAIIRAAAARLSNGGVMAANVVLLSSLHECRTAMKEAGLFVEVLQVQVSRSRSMPHSRMLAAENPVWIVSGVKKEKPS